LAPSKGHADHNGAALNRMEFPMSIKTKIAAIALAALAVTGTLASTTTQAQAKPLNWVGPAIVGAAVIGTAIAASSNDGYYYGYRRCGWTPRYNVYGQFVGNVRVCNF
jgi:hypothetical protein